MAGSWGDSGPLFGVDVNALAPEQTAVIDASTPGAPVRSLREIPAGDYYVQAIVNIYTEFHRADGHTVWLHMDQWEGQHFNRSPGNLYSEVQKVHLDPAAGYDMKLSLTKVIPAVQVPAGYAVGEAHQDSERDADEILGTPDVSLGRLCCCRKGMRSIRTRIYPAIYEHNHFQSCAHRLDFRPRIGQLARRCGRG